MPNLKESEMICKECGSTLIYVRIKTEEVVCRRCGAIYPIKNEND